MITATHEIHTSERRNFRRCRLQWYWNNIQHLEPIMGVKPLEFGIAFHAAMQAFYEPSRWDTTTPEEKYLIAKKVMQEVIAEQQAAFLEATHQHDMASPAYGDDYDERLDLAYGMLKHYAFVTHPNHDTWFRPVRVEIPFRVPLYDPNDLTEIIYCDSSPKCGQEHPNPAQITYDGRVDMIIEDLETGSLWAWDHKTANAIRKSDKFLQIDDQISSYTMALQLMLRLDLKGFIYSEILKGYPKKLKVLESGKRYKGRLLSVDKRTLTNFDIAFDQITNEDPQGYAAGCYDEYIEFLQSADAPKYFGRFVIPQSSRKLAVIASNISMEALDMVDPNIRIYPEVAQATCNYCAFQGPCANKMEGENYKYTLKTLYRVKEDTGYHVQAQREQEIQQEEASI